MRKGRNRRLSSEMLKRKWTKESGRQASVPKEGIQKGITCGTAAGAKQGRAKGNHQRVEYENREGMHEKSGRSKRGKRKKRKQRSSTETAAVRQEQEEQKGRNRRLSSRKQNGSGRKKAEVKRKIRKVKA